VEASRHAHREEQAHFNLQKPLVLSFHGPTGTGQPTHSSLSRCSLCSNALISMRPDLHRPIVLSRAHGLTRQSTCLVGCVSCAVYGQASR
jgi:hypothetical protein